MYDEIRTFFRIMKVKGRYVSQGNCHGACLNVRLKNISSTELIHECPASSYELAISGKFWHMKLCRVTKKFGFSPYTRCSCLFRAMRGKKMNRVDDFIYGSPDLKLMEACAHILQTELKVTAEKIS